MAQQSKEQRDTIERVMHEAKHGELKTARGRRKVRSRRQAIAIALHEAGASKYESPRQNKRNLRHTKAKERRGETYQQEAEGRSSIRRNAERRRTAARRGSRNEPTRAELYARAKRRNIRGRSKMSKSQLMRAVG
jgi:hypothetical protein